MAETKVEKKAKSNKVADFFLGVAAEFTKIMWPKRDDVINQTSVVVVLTMIAFYATSFDSIAYTAACYSYKKLGEEDHPHKLIELLWCILLIVLPIALVFSESSMNNIQSVSIISAFPIGIIMIIMIWSFMKDAKKYRQELEAPEKEKIIPERKRKKKVKEEELVEDESVDVAPTNPGEEIVDLKFDSNTDSLSNDSGLLMDNSNSLSEESLVEDNNEHTPSVDNPTSEETTPPVNNDNGESELMDLFK